MTPTAHQAGRSCPASRPGQVRGAGRRGSRVISVSPGDGRTSGRALASELALPGVGGGARDLSMPARRRGPEPARAGLVHGIGCTAGDYAQPERRRHPASHGAPCSRPGRAGQACAG